MKKLFALVLAAVLVCTLCSCGSSTVSAQPSSVTFDNLPGEMVCEDTTISLSSVSFTEVYADHGYTGYCIATVDRSNLTDDDVYWVLHRDTGKISAEFDVNAYITSEANSLESDRMSALGTTYDDENIYFMFYSSEVQREHLNDFRISLQMIMSPEQDLTAETTQYYYYYAEAEEGVDYSDYDSVMSQKEIEVLVDALNDKIDSLG